MIVRMASSSHHAYDWTFGMSIFYFTINTTESLPYLSSLATFCALTGRKTRTGSSVHAAVPFDLEGVFTEHPPPPSK